MSKLKQDKGFTLIELLVALAIVGIILLAFFTSINSTIRMDAKNDRDIKALNIAQSEIENLRNQIKNHEQLEKLEIKDVINILENEIEYEYNENLKKLNIYLTNIPEIPDYNINDDDNINYDIVYKKSIDGKEFEIYLDISKSEVNTENSNVNTGMYLYTINIKVESFNEDPNKDNHFSKKETKIQDVKILSKNKS